MARLARVAATAMARNVLESTRDQRTGDRVLAIMKLLRKAWISRKVMLPEKIVSAGHRNQHASRSVSIRIVSCTTSFTVL